MSDGFLIEFADFSGILRIHMGEVETYEFPDWSRLDDDDDEDAVTDLVPYGYWPVLWHESGRESHEDAPFESREEALDAGVELVEEWCDIYLGALESAGYEVRTHKTTGEYLETKRVVKRLEKQIDDDQNKREQERSALAGSRKTPEVTGQISSVENEKLEVDEQRSTFREESNSTAGRPSRHWAFLSSGDDSVGRSNLSENELKQIEKRRKKNVSEAGLQASQINIVTWGDLEPRDILNAIDRGFTSSTQYLRYRDLVSDFDEFSEIDQQVASYVRVGVSVPTANELSGRFTIASETAGRWLREGLTEKQLLSWLKDDDSWCRSATGVRETIEWATHGFSPSQKTRWIESGLSRKDAVELLDERFSRTVALRWISAGWNIRVAFKWFSNGFEDPAEASEWKESFGLKVAASWRRNGFEDPGSAREWRELFGPKDAAAWRRNGFNEPGSAQEWAKTFSAEEAGSWLASGINLKSAIRRKSAGLRPEV